jgi:hypothetical protein
VPSQASFFFLLAGFFLRSDLRPHLVIDFFRCQILLERASRFPRQARLGRCPYVPTSDPMAWARRSVRFLSNNFLASVLAAVSCSLLKSFSCMLDFAPSAVSQDYKAPCWFVWREVEAVAVWSGFFPSLEFFFLAAGLCPLSSGQDFPFAVLLWYFASDVKDCLMAARFRIKILAFF